MGKADRSLRPRMVLVCQVLTDWGPGTTTHLHKHIPDITATELHHFCKRGVQMGVVVAQSGTGGKDDRYVYAAHPNWKQIQEARAPKQKVRVRETKVMELAPTKWTGVASIFAYADRCQT